MGIVIDPYVFELSLNEEIEEGIIFFKGLIDLCKEGASKENIRLILYKGVIDRIQVREIQPFPIDIKNISDIELKKTVMILNDRFNNLLLSRISIIDVDECCGNQEFEMENISEMYEDEKYYEMSCVLLNECYDGHHEIMDKIITLNNRQGRKIGETFTIKCRCLEKEYCRTYMFAGIEDILSNETKAIKNIRLLKRDGRIDIAKEVIASMSDHHNHIQADKKSFEYLHDLSRKNSRVLKLLQKIGLFKIIFGRFTSQGVKAIGTMKIIGVENKETQDIVSVKFNAETEFQYITELYFPVGVGDCLKEYFGDNLLEYKNVNEFIERIL